MTSTTMTSTTLTPEGQAWALRMAHVSTVARVALFGWGEWPAQHVEMAIRQCNASADAEWLSERA